MADVLGHGPDEPPRRSPWLVGAGAAVAVAFAAVGVDRTLLDSSVPGNRDAHPAASQQDRTSVPSPPAVERSATPWPQETGACGTVAQLPQVAPALLRERTKLRLVIGGAGLREVDVDRRTVRVIPVRGTGRGGQVTQLAATHRSVLALQLRCEDLAAPAGTALTLDRRDLAIARPAVTGADVLLAAPDRAWSFAYPRRPVLRRVVLHPLDGRPVVDMPARFVPTAVTQQLFYGQTTGAPGTVQAMSRGRHGLPRAVTQGTLLAATDDLLLTSNGCPSAARCILQVDRADRTGRTVSLPRGRVIASDVVVSPDGDRAAFQLARRGPDPRWATDHPGPPSEVAVLDLISGELDLVGHLVLAPKSFAGLTFGKDGRWLVVAVSEGRRTRLLVWRTGWHRPAEVPLALPGRVLHVVPVLDVS